MWSNLCHLPTPSLHLMPSSSPCPPPLPAWPPPPPTRRTHECTARCWRRSAPGLSRARAAGRPSSPRPPSSSQVLPACYCRLPSSACPLLPPLLQCLGHAHAHTYAIYTKQLCPCGCGCSLRIPSHASWVWVGERSAHELLSDGTCSPLLLPPSRRWSDPDPTGPTASATWAVAGPCHPPPITRRDWLALVLPAPAR